MTHAVLFTTHLGGGGAERHALRLANALDGEEFRISVVVARGGGEYESELREDIRYEVLGTPRMVRAVLPLRRKLRELRPDLVCSFLDHANCATILATWAMKNAPAVMVGVQVAPSMQLAGPGLRKRALRGAIRHLYPRADHIIAISRGVRDDLLRLLPPLGKPISVVYNAGAAPEPIHAEEPVDPPVRRRPLIVAAGRLTRQKGFDLLLPAFARLLERRDADLLILGQGELRTELEGIAESLGITRNVRFPGFVPDPLPHMASADVFVLSSRWEGFGNVIVEAMSQGTAVVATDCPHGPGEIIEDRVNGLLVPPGDVDALADAMDLVLSDSDLRKRLSKAGLRRAGDFTAERIAGQYGDLFKDILRNSVDAPVGA